MSGSLTACIERLEKEREGTEGGGSDMGEDSSVSSDDTPDREDPSEAMRRADRLERELDVNPLLYDKHLELISLLAGNPDLDRLRGERERMQTHFPLSEQLWVAWLLDEIPIAQISKEAFSYVISLFDKAVTDYLSVQIWQLYAEFSVSQMHQWGDRGTETVRQVYERAVGEAGLHFGEGDKLWGGYIEMETVLFMGLQEIQAGEREEQSQEISTQVRQQYERISSLYRRRLSAPMIEHRVSLQQARTWDTEAVPDANTLTKVEDMYNALLPHESSLRSSQSHTIEAYRAYMLAEQSMGADTDRIVCMYERCLATHPLNDGVWVEYIRYCDKQVGISAKLKSVHARALRNVPWSKECWIGSIRCREKMGGSLEELMTSAAEISFPNSTDLLDITMEYAGALIRSGTAVSSVIAELDRCRELVQMRQGPEGDPRDRLKQLRIELTAKCGNVSAAREQWEDVMLRHQDEVWFWFKYADFERFNGNAELERNVLLRGVASSKRPRELCERWMEFERVEGTLDQFLSAEEKCRSRETQVTEVAESSEGLFQSRQVLRAARKRVKRGGELVSRAELSKKETKVEFKGNKMRPRKVVRIAESSESGDEGVNKREDKVGSKVGPSKEELPVGSTEDAGAGMDVTQGPSDPLPPSDQSNTIFISNLPYGASRDKIREIFAACGEIANIRLEARRSLKGFVGFGYVQFKECESVDRALKLDRTLLSERLLYVSRYVEKSCPVDMRPQKHERVLDKKTLYLNRLPFEMNRERLEQIVGGYGGVKDVRLITTRKGKARGWAYVEFEEESAAAKALLGLDQLQIGDNRISVSISNPPPSKKREDWLSRKEGGDRKKNEKKEAPHEPVIMARKNPYDRKTHLTLLPRSVRGQEGSEMEQGAERGAMSNEDFKKMLS